MRVGARGGRRAISSILAALVLGCLLLTPAALGSDAETLGPIPEACTGENYEFGTCTVATRLGALSLSPHVVHAGGTITGTIALTGKYKLSWPSAIPYLVQVGSCVETPTCTWKVPANAPTVKYTVLQADVVNNQGVGVSKDYYAIVGKDRFELSGQITDSEAKPVAGVSVEVAGPEHVTLTSDASGSFNAILKRGSYTVTPKSSKTQTFAPEQASVSLSADRSVDFKLRPNVDEVTVSLEQPTLPASGLGATGVTIRDSNSRGEPVEGENIKISPPLGYEIPALVCDSSDRLVYPTTLNDGSLLGGSFERITDGSGEIHLNVFFGTVPGSWLLEAGESKAPLTSYARTSATLTQSGGAPELPQALTSLLIAAGDSTLANFKQDGQRNVLEWLGHIQSQIGGIGFLPIHSTDATGSGQAGVVVYANTPSVRENLLDYLTGHTTFPPGESQAVVIDIGNLQQLLFGSRLAGSAVSTTPYRLPSLSDWANGTVIQIADADVQAFHNQTHIPIPARGRAEFGMLAPKGNESLLYGYGPYPPFAGSIGTQSSFNKCVAYTFATSVTPHSPVRVLIRDAHGDTSGLDAQGKASDDVPGALVSYEGKTLHGITMPSGKYTIQVTGSGNGPATLVFAAGTSGGTSSRVFHFQARKGAKGTIAVNGSQISSTMRFAGHVVKASDGLLLRVHGLPSHLHKGKVSHLSLSLGEQLGHAAGPVSVRASGVAGGVSATSTDAGRLRLTLRPRRRGSITLVFSGAGFQTLRRTLRVR